MKRINLENIKNEEHGFTLLTMSQNKANYFLNILTKSRLLNHPTKYTFPEVIQVHTWLNRIYRTIPDRKIVISKSHSLMAIIEIITEHKFASDNAIALALAKKILATINTLVNFKVPLNELNHESKQIIFFYESYLKKNDFTDNSYLLQELENKVPKNIFNINLLIDSEVVAKQTPILKSILSNFNNLATLDTSRSTSNKLLIESCLDESSYFTNISGSCAIYVPHLEQKITKIKRLINNTFDEDKIYNTHVCSNSSLADYPEIKAVFKILEIDKENMSLDLIESILMDRHLFFIDQEEIAATLINLRKTHENIITTKNLLKILKFSNLDDIALQLSSIPDNLTMNEYSKIIAEVLKLTIWPGRKATKAIDKFINIINQLQQEQFVTSLPRELIAKTFQQIIGDYYVLEDNPNSKYQILDLQEAADRHFDNILMLDMDDDNFPNYIQPSSYFSDVTNKKYKIIKCDTEVLQEQQQFLDTIIANNPNVVIKYLSEFDKSSLLEKYNNENIAKSESFYKKFIFADSLSNRDLFNNIPLTQTEHNIGTYQLKEYQVCNFKSFAKYRLRLSEQEQPSLGLSPKDKGIVIHEVLQKLYNHHKSINQVLITENKENEISLHIENLLSKYLNKKPLSGNKNYISNTKNSLLKMIIEFLKLEKTREKFTVIATEKQHQLKIADMTIKCIIDRVDEVANNQYLLLDYKTGHATPSHWFEPLQDPQMPIYSIIYKKEVIGAAFAKINHMQVTYSGIVDPDYQIPGTLTKHKSFTEWQSILDYWDETITNLVISYSKGSTALTPRDNTVCKNCDYQRLCRVWDGE